MMIRRYQKEDFNELIALLKRNIPEYFAPEEEADYSDYLTHHLEDYFVVTEDDTIIGAGGINYFPEEKTARISWDAIHPDFHGKGVGRKLTQYRIDLLKNNPEINLIVVRTTQLVYKFYEKMGFQLEKTEKDFWAEGFDLYQMSIRLK
ncbi:GNAT family N-acetyltransferase [Flavobacterium pedocola]